MFKNSIIILLINLSAPLMSQSLTIGVNTSRQQGGNNEMEFWLTDSAKKNIFTKAN